MPLDIVFYSPNQDIRDIINASRDDSLEPGVFSKRLFQAHSSEITCLVYFSIPSHGDERHILASGSSDCTVRLWDLGYTACLIASTEQGL